METPCHNWVKHHLRLGCFVFRVYMNQACAPACGGCRIQTVESAAESGVASPTGRESCAGSSPRTAYSSRSARYTTLSAVKRDAREKLVTLITFQVFAVHSSVETASCNVKR